MEKITEKDFYDLNQEIDRQNIVIDALCIVNKSLTKENSELSFQAKKLDQENTKLVQESTQLRLDYQNLVAYLREYHPLFIDNLERNLKRGGQA